MVRVISDSIHKPWWLSFLWSFIMPTFIIYDVYLTSCTCWHVPGLLMQLWKARSSLGMIKASGIPHNNCILNQHKTAWYLLTWQSFPHGQVECCHKFTVCLHHLLCVWNAGILLWGLAAAAASLPLVCTVYVVWNFSTHLPVHHLNVLLQQLCYMFLRHCPSENIHKLFHLWMYKRIKGNSSIHATQNLRTR